MLQSVATDIWHAQHKFKAGGLAVSSRMTVVRLRDGRLWLHSPIALSAALVQQLNALGEVAYIVAPNKFHHLFAQQAVQAFPTAQLYGPGGLRRKRPDLSNLIALPPAPIAAWA